MPTLRSVRADWKGRHVDGIGAGPSLCAAGNVRARGLTAGALVTLALGIGAHTAIFTVLNALVLRPLPYKDPERFVIVWQDLRARGGPATEWTGPSSRRVTGKCEMWKFGNLKELLIRLNR